MYVGYPPNYWVQNSPVKDNGNATAYNDVSNNCTLLTLWQQFDKMLPCFSIPLCKKSGKKTIFYELDEEELKWSGQNQLKTSDINWNADGEPDPFFHYPYFFLQCILDNLFAKRAKILTDTPKSCGNVFHKSGCCYNCIDLEGGGDKAQAQPHKTLVLVWDVHQAYIDVMVGYPQPFSHLM